MHHLRTPGRASYPTRHVALVCHARLDAEASGTDRHHYGLERWEAVAWTADGARVIKEFRSHGEDAATFWAKLAPVLQTGGLAWVWCVDAARCLSLLGAWEWLERGWLKLAGSDPCAPAPVGGNGCGNCDGLLVIEDPPTLVQLKLPDLAGTIQFTDLRNYGVSGWGSLPGAEHTPDRIAVFVRAMLSELHVRGWGSLKATAASQAWHTWRYRHNDIPVHAHNVKPVLALERDAYYGGRCEAFRIAEYKGRVWQYDFASCYPALCRDHALPVGLLCYDMEGSSPALPPADGTLGLIADVTLRTDRPDYPCRIVNGAEGRQLPYHYWRRDPSARVISETCWPVGTFRTALAGPELEMARAAGHIVSWHRWAAYRLAPCLSGFAADLLEARAQYKKAGNRALEEWAKALSTSVVGKAGQCSTRWVTDHTGHKPEPYASYLAMGPDGNYVRWRVIAGVAQREEWSPDHPEAVPALAAWVTSLARVRLDAALVAASPDRVLYCDTDSLFVTAAGAAALRQSGMVGTGAPGTLREVGVERGMTVYGHKHYKWGDKRVCAGVPVDLERRAGGREGYWYQQGIKDSLQGRRRPEPVRTLRTFTSRALYRGGIVDEQGVVQPHQFGRGPVGAPNEG